MEINRYILINFTFLVFCISSIFSVSFFNQKLNKNYNKYHEAESDTGSAWRGFSHVRSVPIRGTAEHPVYNVENLAMRDSLIVVLERKSATLTAFNLEGEFQYQVGSPGRAPGQFTNPYWVGFDVRGRIAVLEGQPNNRFQFINPGNGKSLDVLTEDVLVTPKCDHVYFYENENGDHRVIFSTQASCTSSSGVLCTIQKHDITSSKLISRFARKDRVDKNALGVPWILDFNGSDKLYLSHVHGVNINIYNMKGEYIDKIDLSKLDVFSEIDYSKVRGEGAGELVEADRSLVWDISAVKGDVVVHHSQKTEGDMTYYMSIFDERTGGHLATTPGWSKSKRGLVEVQGDRFLFVETDRESEVGSYVIHEYRYEGIGK